jgi:general secretion pathway protein D
MTRLTRGLVVAAALIVSSTLAGCAGNALKQAKVADELREYDLAVAKYQEYLRQKPTDKEALAALERAKLRASDAHLFQGRRLGSQGRYEEAVVELQLAVELNPTNAQAENELRSVRTALRLKLSAPPEGQTRLESVLDRSRELLPTGFELPNTKLPSEIVTGTGMTSRMLYLMLGKLGNISVTFDSLFREAPAQVSLLSGMTLKQALDAVSKSTNTFYQVSSPSTIIVAPDTPAKRREYQEEVFGTIFIRNVDVKETMDALRVVGDLRSIAPITNLNAITVRDTPERFMAARRFVAAFDKARPEIVVDVEILEVSRAKLREYGLQIASPGAPGISGSFDPNRAGMTVQDLRTLSAADVLASNIPALYYRLIKTDDRTRTLANPHIRILDGVTASANFGEDVPVPKTLITPITQGGLNIQPQTTFDYRKVGVNIGITPRTHPNDEVTMVLNIELSTQLASAGFEGLPKFGSRNVQTTIRLRDGQTNILAGLIRDDERLLREGAIPGIGSLFGRNRREVAQTDVVVMLTPHIIRELSLTEEDLRPFRIPREGSGVALIEGVVPPPPIIKEARSGLGGGGSDSSPQAQLPPPSFPVSVGTPTGMPLAPIPAPPKVIKN